MTELIAFKVSVQIPANTPDEIFDQLGMKHGDLLEEWLTNVVAQYVQDHMPVFCTPKVEEVF